MKIKVGLIDDHQLFLKSLSLMLETLNDFEVVVEATAGKDLQNKLSVLKILPDLMLVDVNMPGMNGVEVAEMLQSNFPEIRLIALSMNDKEVSIIEMFKAGCCSYLLKDVHPNELQKALHEVHRKGYYNAETTSFSMKNFLSRSQNEIVLTPKEKEFLQLACSEKTYKQIAYEMGVSERTVDGYREALFRKFDVQSRVGLCLEAIRKNFVKL